MTVRVRQLELGEESQLLELLRSALMEEPLAFVTSPEDDSMSSLESIREGLRRSPNVAIFGAFDGCLVGMLWLAREPRKKLSHKALIWRAFVRKEFRGRGIGGQLLGVAISHARGLDGLAALRLGVSDRSPAAHRLYERYGFRVWGVEPDCIRSNGESAQLYWMTLPLDKMT